MKTMKVIGQLSWGQVVNRILMILCVVGVNGCVAHIMVSELFLIE